MAEERTIETLFQSEGASQFQIDLASLSQSAQQQARDVVERAAADGTLSELDLDLVIANARDADAARENAEDLQVEQAKATAEGDYARAEELSTKAEYELRVVEQKGDDPIHAAEAIDSADHEQMNLQHADFQAVIAAENLQSAEAYAASGDLDAASMHADSAADHAIAAIDHAGGNETIAQTEQHDATDTMSE